MNWTRDVLVPFCIKLELWDATFWVVWWPISEPWYEPVTLGTWSIYSGSIWFVQPAKTCCSCWLHGWRNRCVWLQNCALSHKFNVIKPIPHTSYLQMDSSYSKWMPNILPTYVCVYIYIHIYIYICMICIYIYTYTCIYIYTHTYIIYIYIYISDCRIHKYVCICIHMYRCWFQHVPSACLQVPLSTAKRRRVRLHWRCESTVCPWSSTGVSWLRVACACWKNGGKTWESNGINLRIPFLMRIFSTRVSCGCS